MNTLISIVLGFDVYYHYNIPLSIWNWGFVFSITAWNSARQKLQQTNNQYTHSNFKMKVSFGEFEFDSDFDSGNLHLVKRLDTPVNPESSTQSASIANSVSEKLSGFGITSSNSQTRVSPRDSRGSVAALNSTDDSGSITDVKPSIRRIPSNISNSSSQTLNNSSRSFVPTTSKDNSTSKLQKHASESVANASVSNRDYIFQLWTRPDGFDTETPTKNRTWFFFSVTYSPKTGQTQKKPLSKNIPPKPPINPSNPTPSIERSREKEVSSKTVEFRMMSLNKVKKLFAAGLRPVFRHQEDLEWRRLHVSPVTKMSTEGDFEVDFIFTFGVETVPFDTTVKKIGTKSCPAPPGRYYFAYCIPYTYGQLQKKLAVLEAQYPVITRADDESSLEANPIGSKIPKDSPKKILKLRSKIPRVIKPKQPKKQPVCDEDRVYFHRDVLVHTTDGLNLDVITVSSYAGMLASEEDCKIPGLFPSKPGRNFKRCRSFTMQTERPQSEPLESTQIPAKRYVFISSRVHPAETISSFMLDGFIDFIVSEDPRAKLLRSLFVFKIIPMLNPDGVFRGNYRGDMRGVNLNRVYVDPDQFMYPTIWAAKTYVTDMLLKSGCVSWYFDFHGHANKWGCFLFGNWVPDIPKQIEMMTFARLMHFNCPLFDFGECDFAPKGMLDTASKPSTAVGSNQMYWTDTAAGRDASFDNMQSIEKTKDGTGRVAMYRAIGTHHCYTFEANYYGCRFDRRPPMRYSNNATTPHDESSSSNDEAASQNKSIKKVISSIPKPLSADDKRFTLADMKQMGKSIAWSILDMEVPAHPWSRIPNADPQGMVGIQLWAVERVRRMYERNHQTFDDWTVPPFARVPSRL